MGEIADWLTEDYSLVSRFIKGCYGQQMRR